MSKFSIGNVIKTKYGHIEIVTQVTDENTHTVSFSHSNSSAVHKNKTHVVKELCWDCDINDGGDGDEDCTTCKGTGQYDKTVYGMDEAVLLGDNVKSYIMKNLTKNFDF